MRGSGFNTAENCRFLIVFSNFQKIKNLSLRRIRTYLCLSLAKFADPYVQQIFLAISKKLTNTNRQMSFFYVYR